MSCFPAGHRSSASALLLAPFLVAGVGVAACFISIDESLWQKTPADSSVEAARRDAPVREMRADALKRPDAFRVPDGGCPSGYTQCGTICAELSSDIEHCGACDRPCATDTADRCQQGQCRCGDQSPCSESLNCVAGSCECAAQGRCDGCCEGRTCVPIGATQSANKCGERGEACTICNDGGNICTQDVCLAGKCQYPALNDGVACPAGFCTLNPTCQKGTCVGIVRDCSAMADSCNDAGCDDTAAQCTKLPKPSGTACDLDGLFCTDDTCQGGSCTANATRSCSNLNDKCNVGACNETTNQCEKQPKTDGTGCDDGNSCTESDRCTSGVCAGTPKPDGTSCGFGSSCCGGACCGFMSTCCPDKTCKMFCS